ncbi:hypothetical protein COOONC_18772 [Cooperia oncophora]
MIYNLYVSRYRCPQNVVIYPAPPNRIVLSVQNLDIGITGNLGGQIVILLPIALFGIIQINIHQVSFLNISRFHGQFCCLRGDDACGRATACLLNVI